MLSLNRKIKDTEKYKDYPHTGPAGASAPVGYRFNDVGDLEPEPKAQIEHKE